MNQNNKLLRYLLNLDMIIAAAALAVIIVITFVGVPLRYFMNAPIVWEEEVQIWCFIWVIFLGGGAAFRTGSHVAIEFLVDMLPSKIKKVFEVLIYLIVMAVLVYFVIHGTTLVNQIIAMKTSTNILKVPNWLIYSAFPIGCAIMMVDYTILTVKTLFNKDCKVRAVVEDGI